VGSFMVAFLVNALRVVAAAFVMALLAGGLWLLVGIISSGAGVHSPQFVLVAVTAIAVWHCSREVTSLLDTLPPGTVHPVLAALVLAFYMCHCSPRAILMA